MLIATINDKEYQIADSWQDVKLSAFTHYLSNVMPSMPAALKKIQGGDKDALKSLEDSDYYALFLPFFCKVIETFSDIPYSVLMQCDKTSVEAIYQGIGGTLVTPSQQDVRGFRIQGELYYLPQKFMQGAKVADFVEAAHLERVIGKDSSWSAMADVCCVLLRKKGEDFSDDLLKRKSFFLKNLTMWQAYQVSFFLSRLNKIYANVSEISLTNLVPKLLGQEEAN